MGNIETSEQVQAIVEMSLADESGIDHAAGDKMGDRLPEPKQAETIEDFEAMSPSEVDEALVLDDDALVQSGMVPIKAWARSKASANALRQRRKRERQAEGGAKQVAVLAPADEASREALKAVGAAMRDGALEAALVSQMAGTEPAFAQKLFALDPKVVELVAGCDTALVERLLEVAAMLERDPAYVMLSMKLDEALVRRILDSDQALVAQVLALPEADLRKTVMPVGANEAPDEVVANAEKAFKPRSRGWRALLPKRFKAA